MTSRSCSGDDTDLTREHRLGLARLALGLGLPHAGDDVEAGLERRLGAKPYRLVRLAEVLAPLGVADDRARHAELEQHRRRDLARERALELPVDVLRVDADAAVGAEALQRRLERDVRRADDDVDSCRVLRDRRICAANSRAWCAPLNIFQLPAMSMAAILRL